jgi:TRAP-type C4-dicarboxylate transport system substrate-binding protein
MTKKLLVLSIVSIVIFAIIFGGCSETTTTSTAASTTATTSPAASTTAPAKTLNLKFSYLMSNTNSTGKGLDAWAAAVTEQTQGRVKVTTYPSNTLVESGDAYSAVQKGVADIAFGSVGDFPDLWPLGQVFSQPMVKIPLQAKSPPFYKECMDTIPELKAEIDDANIHLLMDYNGGAETCIHTTKKLIRVPADAAGLKIIAIGGFVEYVKAFGASAIGLFPPDHYMALDRGTADGVMVPYSVMDTSGYTELVPYHLTLNLAGPRFFVYINQDIWDQISPEDQATITEISQATQSQIIADGVAFNDEVMAKIKSLNQTVTVPTDAGKPMLDTWIQKCDGLGYQSQQIYEKVKALADKYR